MADRNYNDSDLAHRDLLRVFDWRFLLIPVATRKISWQRTTVSSSMTLTETMSFVEVFVFGFRVARIQVGPLPC